MICFLVKGTWEKETLGSNTLAERECCSNRWGLAKRSSRRVIRDTERIVRANNGRNVSTRVELSGSRALLARASAE